MPLVETLTDIGFRSDIFTFMNTQWGWPVVESLHFIGLTPVAGHCWIV